MAGTKTLAPTRMRLVPAAAVARATAQSTDGMPVARWSPCQTLSRPRLSACRAAATRSRPSRCCVATDGRMTPISMCCEPLCLVVGGQHPTSTVVEVKRM
jgi:hypothetical protein